VKDKSYLSASGPFVNPHTRGAVFRNSTTETRNFFKDFLSFQQKLSHKYNIGTRFVSRTG
jgi:hypothetical protein